MSCFEKPNVCIDCLCCALSSRQCMVLLLFTSTFSVSIFLHWLHSKCQEQNQNKFISVFKYFRKMYSYSNIVLMKVIILYMKTNCCTCLRILLEVSNSSVVKSLSLWNLIVKN